MNFHQFINKKSNEKLTFMRNFASISLIVPNHYVFVKIFIYKKTFSPNHPFGPPDLIALCKSLILVHSIQMEDLMKQFSCFLLKIKLVTTRGSGSGQLMRLKQHLCRMIKARIKVVNIYEKVTKILLRSSTHWKT